jgi:protein-disulfide isomerase
VSKRQEIKARRHRREVRARVMPVILVTAGALLVAFVMILFMNPPEPSDELSFATVETHTSSVPVDWTSAGNPDAPVRMDVWGDFLCAGCQAYALDIEPQVFANYVETGLVLYTFHFFPIASHGEEASQSAHAAACAAEQGRFWDYHALIYTNFSGSYGSLTDPYLLAFADSLGLDADAFGACFAEQRYEDRIDEDHAAGRSIGVDATPSIFVSGQVVENATNARYIPTYEDISSAIEAALAAAP